MKNKNILIEEKKEYIVKKKSTFLFDIVSKETGEIIDKANFRMEAVSIITNNKGIAILDEAEKDDYITKKFDNTLIAFVK